MLRLGSIRRAFPAEFPARLTADVEPVERALVADLVPLDSTRAEVDATFEQKQPDWTHDETDLGQSSVGLPDHRAD